MRHSFRLGRCRLGEEALGLCQQPLAQFLADAVTDDVKETHVARRVTELLGADWRSFSWGPKSPPIFDYRQ
ncbi:hypothetical protein [Halomonas shantousis]